MARSDQAPRIAVTWDDKNKQWVTFNARAGTLGRIKKMNPQALLDPQGQIIDDVVKARAAMVHADTLAKSKRHAFRQHVIELVLKHKMSQSDVAALAGVSKQWVGQIVAAAEQSGRRRAA